MLNGIFTIGLFFAVPFLRSGNLWMVAFFRASAIRALLGLSRNDA